MWEAPVFLACELGECGIMRLSSFLDLFNYSSLIINELGECSETITNSIKRWIIIIYGPNCLVSLRWFDHQMSDFIYLSAFFYKIIC